MTEAESEFYENGLSNRLNLIVVTHAKGTEDAMGDLLLNEKLRMVGGTAECRLSVVNRLFDAYEDETWWS